MRPLFDRNSVAPPGLHQTGNSSYGFRWRSTRSYSQRPLRGRSAAHQANAQPRRRQRQPGTDSQMFTERTGGHRKIKARTGREGRRLGRFERNMPFMGIIQLRYITSFGISLE
jgi:hypothetical protein